MLSLSRQFRPHRCLPRPGQARAVALLRAGFTLIEIVIALAVLGTMAAGCYIGFNAINSYAVSSRLYSEALSATQNQIDLVLSREPFDVAGAYPLGVFDPCQNKVPVELMTVAELDALASHPLCGATFPTAAPTATPATTSSYYPYYPYYRTNSGPDAGLLKKQAFIYKDPVTGQVIVTGELTSTVTDTGMTMNFISAANLNTRKANITVKYTFRRMADSSDESAPAARGDYTLSMDTLRTANQ